jgi:hypothetical protein
MITVLWLTSGRRVETLRTPESGISPISMPVYGEGETITASVPELRVGSFEPPERVPEYDLLEERPVQSDEARAIRLLVSTAARGRANYVLITRDLKARFAGYDAVSVEFTDTEDFLDYDGSALIFNTTNGAIYMGFIYGPPNTEGYYVRAAD